MDEQLPATHLAAVLCLPVADLGRHHPAGGGCPGVLGSESSMHAHEGADSVQIVSDGFASSGSSKVPARKIVR